LELGLNYSPFEAIILAIRVLCRGIQVIFFEGGDILFGKGENNCEFKVIFLDAGVIFSVFGVLNPHPPLMRWKIGANSRFFLKILFLSDF
jgi:hypothetical protein